MLDWSLLSYLAVASFLLINIILFKILSASRSPLHALPGPKRASLLLGNVAEATIFSSSERNHPEEWNDIYGGVVLVHGLLGTKPELCVSDPEFLHRIYVSDNDSWPKPKLFNNVTRLILGRGVFSAHGNEHKRQRKMLNPMFTAAHTRALTPAMYDVAHKLSRKISDIIASHDTSTTVVDVLKLSSATALDIIGSAGLGHDFNALGAESDYLQAIKHISPTVGEMTAVVPFLEPLSYLGPYSFRSWVMETFCPFLGSFGRSVLKLRQILGMMHGTSRTIYLDRRAFIANEDALGEPTESSKTDVLSNLVRATSKDSDTVLDEEEVVAHINGLIFAGFETSSNIISHTLDVLATRQDLQDRLRTEIFEAREAVTADDIGYDTIMDLPLLDAVVRETLRLFPPLPVIARESTADAVIPFALPVRSADSKTEITEIFVPKNTTVHVSIAGLNRSRAIWGEDAKEFKPERWLRPEGPVGEASKLAFERIPTVFASVITFAAGPKGCIGWRMAVLEIKIVLAVLLQRFRFQHRSDRAVRWIYGPLTFPAVTGDEATGPQLPLIVSEVAP